METPFPPLLRILAVSAAALLTAGLSTAQIDIGDKLKKKAAERLERKVDRTIDKGFDKTEEGVDKGAREATKGKKGKKDKSAPEAAGEEAAPASGTPAASGPQATLRAYGKFDFVPGDQLIAYDDFSQDAIGDFPARWNTNGGGDVVTVDGAEGRWFRLGNSSMAYPEHLDVLPDHFTVEMDVTALEQSASCASLHLYFRTAEGSMLQYNDAGRVTLKLLPRGTDTDGAPYVEISVLDPSGAELMSNSRWLPAPAAALAPPITRVSIQRQKSRLRMYLNEDKVWDIPRAFSDGVPYRLVLEDQGCEEHRMLVSDLRVAVGAPDTRNKLIADGRLVTRGIHFDSGKDQVRPESYGTLKEIATVLRENPTVKVRIIGHTDSDGDDARNLDLSKRRAAAVKAALSQEFSIDGSRMATDGKGEAEPAGPNDTPEGKANNRRVEFVKL
ncbi:MAG: OmpA family protein [Flavobacteriales bacterium]|jgi:outer membrane protein OmpA-like peptidoglycan-associated protein|nr:OmpA family protein [Flavobacteriales bacterium]